MHSRAGGAPAGRRRCPHRLPHSGSPCCPRRYSRSRRPSGHVHAENAHGQLPLAKRAPRRMAAFIGLRPPAGSPRSNTSHVAPSGPGRSRRQVTWLTSAEYDDSIGEKGNAVGGGSLDLASDAEVDRTACATRANSEYRTGSPSSNCMRTSRTRAPIWQRGGPAPPRREGTAGR